MMTVSGSSRNNSGVLRAVVLVAAAIETFATAVLTWWGLNEGPGMRIAAPLAKIALLMFALTVLPAAVLALMRRHLWVALALVTVPLVLAIAGCVG